MENFNQQLSQIFRQPGVTFLFFTWVTFWKGWGLWRAANKRQLIWFIALLLVNTLGLLEIAYIFSLHKWDIDKGKLLTFLERKFAKKDSS